MGWEQKKGYSILTRSEAHVPLLLAVQSEGENSTETKQQVSKLFDIAGVVYGISEIDHEEEMWQAHCKYCRSSLYKGYR